MSDVRDQAEGAPAPDLWTTAEGARLRAAVRRAVGSLRKLLTDPGFAPDPYHAYSSGRRVRVTTAAEPGAPILPVTGRPIRGAEGVETRVSTSEASFARRPPTVASLLTDAMARGPRTPSGEPVRDPLPEPWAEMRAATEAWVAAAFATPALGRRVYEAYGYKYYDRAELDEKLRDVAPEGGHAMMAGLVLQRLLEGALSAHEFRPEAPAEFGQWDGVAIDVEAALTRMAARDVYQYRVRALLNGPLVDREGPLVLAGLADWIDRVVEGPITLEFATDGLLEQMTTEYEARELTPALQRSNTVLSFTVRQHADAAVERYRELYPIAADVVSRVVDVLRLVTPDDIGVAYLATREVEPFTPGMPLNYAWEYQPRYAANVPRRLAFSAPSLPTFSEAQRTEAERLILRRLDPPDVKGLGVMLRRFRDSYERYDVRDPERLLDLAIALEAVFLNDNDSKEQLSFRLALRVARLLGGTLAERKTLFRGVRDLYNIRSKVAHGETVDTLSPRDSRTLIGLQASAPPLVRRAVTRMLEDGGPTGLTGPELREWWTDLELGGAPDDEARHNEGRTSEAIAPEPRP